MKNILIALSVAFVCAACSTPVNFTEYGKGEPTQIELTAHALDTAILYSDGLFVRDSLIINVNPQNRNSLFDIFSKTISDTWVRADASAAVQTSSIS